MPTLGKFIQRRRVALGLTQEQLAERIGSGVRQSEISRLEHDRISLPRRQRLEQIALALDVSLGELLVRSGWADADVEFTPAAPPDPVVPNGAATVEEVDTQALSEAIARAEQLISDADAIVEKSQVTFDQARRSVRYNQASRKKELLSQ